MPRLEYAQAEICHNICFAHVTQIVRQMHSHSICYIIYHDLFVMHVHFHCYVIGFTVQVQVSTIQSCGGDKTMARVQEPSGLCSGRCTLKVIIQSLTRIGFQNWQMMT